MRNFHIAQPYLKPMNEQICQSQTLPPFGRSMFWVHEGIVDYYNIGAYFNLIFVFWLND